MAIVAINLGTSPTGAGGDTNREAFTKVNDAFIDLADALSTEDVGTAAYLNVGTTAGTVAAGDDARFATAGLIEVTAARTLVDTDRNQTLALAGTFAITLPDSLTANLQVPLLVRPGSVITFATTGTATVVPEGVTLDTTGSAEVTSALLAHVASGEWFLLAGQPVLQSFTVAASDATTALTVGSGKVAFRMPFPFFVTAVRAHVRTAPTGSVLTVDINEAGTSILSTKLTIDATERTSTTAATAAVISDASLADDAEITIDVDTIGSTIAGAGLVVSIIGYRL